MLESLKCEVIVEFVLAKCLPLKCEVKIVMALCLTSRCRGCVCKERSCVLPVIVLPKSSVKVPCVGSPVWTR